MTNVKHPVHVGIYVIRLLKFGVPTTHLGNGGQGGVCGLIPGLSLYQPIKVLHQPTGGSNRKG